MCIRDRGFTTPSRSVHTRRPSPFSRVCETYVVASTCSSTCAMWASQKNRSERQPQLAGLRGATVF
eukprot:6135152-Prymnesium_polylepis.1